MKKLLLALGAWQLSLWLPQAVKNLVLTKNLKKKK